jgi:hypothetical protein
MFSFSFFFPAHDGRPKASPSKSFHSGLVGKFALFFLVTFQSELLNAETSLSYRLADLHHLMAAFAFGR